MSPSEFYVYRKGNAMDLNDLTAQFKTYVAVRENVPTNVEIGLCDDTIVYIHIYL